MKFFFIYSIRYWDEINEKEEMIHGIVQARNYAKAIQKITDDYGEENILDVSITAISNDNTLELRELSEAVTSDLLKEDLF